MNRGLLTLKTLLVFTPISEEKSILIPSLFIPDQPDKRVDKPEIRFNDFYGSNDYFLSMMNSSLDIHFVIFL